MSTLTAALSYARRGWPVVPLHVVRNGRCSCWDPRRCGTPGKHPATRNGLKDASTDPRVIVTWFRQRPWLNLGLCTGNRSMIVIDIDPDKGGEDSLYELQRRYGRLPDTVEAITGGGGRHLCFAPPAGMAIRNKQCWTDFPGLDVRGDGGYIVAVPSLHRSGRHYEWEATSDPSEVELAALPPAYLALLTRGTAVKPREQAYQPRLGSTLAPAAPVVQGCPWIQHAIRDAKTLPEGEWYALLSVAAVLEDGRRLAHEWSRSHPKYTPDETERKLAHAGQDTGPATCVAIQRQWGGGRHCAGCIHRGRIAGPVALGRRLAELEMLAPPPRRGELARS